MAAANAGVAANIAGGSLTSVAASPTVAAVCSTKSAARASARNSAGLRSRRLSAAVTGSSGHKRWPSAKRPCRRALLA